MQGSRFWRAWIVSTVALPAAAAQAQPELIFVPANAALPYAVRAYQEIWDEDGERIVTALETRTCLPFSEPSVTAIVDYAVSHSGGPDYPMRLRGSYAPDVKKSTLVHELGHRHLWQLAERLEGVDGHMTLYLILDRVWADVWGEEFADDRVQYESNWGDDYAVAWAWAKSLGSEERLRLWNRLLIMNGFPDGCGDSPDVAE
ncbi:MAG: hypothetical protein OXQ89_13925 [Rhodospirillaceae bacterium]|nr:hypothetical protein [Rhodospirillaceae bacterium]MDD9998835.1 hypothetical protein [Rhodospirillaceae bacterium]MDE0363231.1 hypothetical protein [Rhodospirillaceae bacterium]